MDGNSKKRTEERYLSHYVIKEEYLYRKEDEETKLVVPLKFINKIIEYFHESDHPGSKETIRRIKRRFFCRGLEKRVYKYVKNCLSCAQIKSQQRQEPVPMRTYRPEKPFQMISIDILGPYIKTKTGNKYILVIEDVYSKWTEAKAFPMVDAKTIITYLEEEIISRFGPPRTIVSDHGGVFLSNVFMNWCGGKNIERQLSAIEHQRANPVERRVQEMKKLLRLFTKEDTQNKWDEHLHKVMLSLRKRRNEATGMTPAKIILGYELPEYGEWTLDIENGNPENTQTREQLLEQVNENQNRYKNKYAPAEAVPKITYNPGQKVLVKLREKRRDVFHCPWKGPFTITRKISNEVYEIDKNGKLSQIHSDNLRLAPEGNHPDDADESDDSDSTEGEDPGANEPENNTYPRENPDQQEGLGGPASEAEAEALLPSTAMDEGQQPELRNYLPTLDPPRRRRRRARIVIRDASPSTSERE